MKLYLENERGSVFVSVLLLALFGALTLQTISSLRDTYQGQQKANQYFASIKEVRSNVDRLRSYFIANSDETAKILKGVRAQGNIVLNLNEPGVLPSQILGAGEKWSSNITLKDPVLTIVEGPFAGEPIYHIRMDIEFEFDQTRQLGPNTRTETVTYFTAQLIQDPGDPAEPVIYDARSFGDPAAINMEIGLPVDTSDYPMLRELVMFLGACYNRAADVGASNAPCNPSNPSSVFHAQGLRDAVFKIPGSSPAAYREFPITKPLDGEPWFPSKEKS